MALTKAEIAEALFDQLGLNKREARELVDLFFEELRASLATGEQVKLSGFGNFDLRSKNQRPGRNPKTGEEIPISARRVVTFGPWPAMMPERIGTIGSTQGVKASSSPAPKKKPMTSSRLPERMNAAILSCLDTKPPAAADIVPPAGKSTFRVLVIGG